MKTKRSLLLFGILSFLTILVMIVLSNRGTEVPLYINKPICLSSDRMEKLMKDKPSLRNGQYKYKLIAFVDSKECTPCAINQLYAWYVYFEINRKILRDVELIPVFDVIKSDMDRIKYAYRNSAYQDAIYLDTCHSFTKENAFINHSCVFLVNSSGKILSSGNPLKDSKAGKRIRSILN